MVYTVFYKTSSFAGYCFLNKNSIHLKRLDVFSFRSFNATLVKFQICSFIVQNTTQSENDFCPTFCNSFYSIYIIHAQDSSRTGGKLFYAFYMRQVHRLPQVIRTVRRSHGSSDSILPVFPQETLPPERRPCRKWRGNMRYG